MTPTRRLTIEELRAWSEKSTRLTASLQCGSGAQHQQAQSVSWPRRTSIPPRPPLLDSATFPAGALAWDFNYRGPLPFLAHAKASHATIEDGWAYFVAGWSAALAAISRHELVQPDYLRAVEAAAANRQSAYQRAVAATRPAGPMSMQGEL